MVEFFANSLRDYVRKLLIDSGVKESEANNIIFLSPDSENALCFKGAIKGGIHYIWYWKVSADLNSRKFVLHEVVVDSKNVAPYTDNVYNYRIVQDVIDHIFENIITYIEE